MGRAQNRRAIATLSLRGLFGGPAARERAGGAQAGPERPSK